MFFIDNNFFDVIVVGGGPAGLSFAVEFKKLYSEKKILVVRGNVKPEVPCGIPYVFNSTTPTKNLLPEIYDKFNIDLIVDDVLKVDVDNKKVFTKNNNVFYYDKLVLATGSKPRKIPNTENIDGVFYVYKNFEYVSFLKKKFEESKDIVLLGGGFIGVEFADEFSKSKDKNITLIERGSHILNHILDFETSIFVKDKLESLNVNVLTNTFVKEFVLYENSNKLKGLILNDDSFLKADFVLVGIGAEPNVDLALNSNINIFEGFVEVDDYQRTKSKDVFAIGDCAFKKSFLTGKACKVLLATTAVVEARFLAHNIYNINFFRKVKGVIPTSGSVVGNLFIASSGVTEEDLVKDNFSFFSSSIMVDDKHPCSLPEDHKIFFKGIFSYEGKLLGAQILGFGTDKVGEMINVVNVLLENNMSVFDIVNLQLASHPKLHSSPLHYPLIQVALDVISRMKIKK